MENGLRARVLYATGLLTVVTGCGTGSPNDSQQALTESAALNQAPAASDDPNVVDISAVADLSEYVAPPGSPYLMHKSCVHAVPDGAHIRRHHDTGVVDALAPDGTGVSYPRCAKPMVRKPASASGSASSKLQPPAPDGWAARSEAYATSNSGYAWFNQIVGSWYVPANPSHTGGLIYFFDGLQSPHEIIQPVLQWGYNGYFGGNYWTIASWHVYHDDGGGAYYSPTHSAAAGDFISGDTWATECESAGYCNWAIQTYWWHSQGHSYLTTMYIDAFAYPNGVDEVFNRADEAAMENYNLTACNQYPPDGGVEIFDSYIYQPLPTDITAFNDVSNYLSWYNGYPAPGSCGQDAFVGDHNTLITY